MCDLNNHEPGVTNAQNILITLQLKEVGKSIENSLPETALEWMAISKQAENDENPAQFTKAMVYLTLLKMQYGEEALLEVDSMFVAALKKQNSPYLEITMHTTRSFSTDILMKTNMR